MPDQSRVPAGRRRPAVAGERRGRVRQPGEPSATDAQPPQPAPRRGTAAPPAPAPGEQPAPGTRRRNRLAVLVGVLLVATVLLGALTAFFLVTVRQRNEADRARSAALEAARASAVDLLSYDFHHLDADFAKAKTHLTGPFAQEYADTSTKVVQPTATEFQAVVSASVTGAAVKTATSRSAVVLVFVNQTSSNTKVPAPHVDQNRVRMTLTKLHGKWLVSKLEAL